MINKIWTNLIIIGMLYMLFRGYHKELNNLVLSIPSDAFKLFLTFAPLIVFWSGVMEVTKDSGFLKVLTKGLSPFVNWLFKNEKKETKELISANIAANLLGLGSAATPYGLAAMQSMQDTNSNKEKATNGMTKLLLLNTSGLTLVPTYIISVRNSIDHNAFDITLLVMMATGISTLTAIILMKVLKL